MNNFIMEIIGKYIRATDISEDQDLREIGLDSMNMISLLLDIEEQFSIVVPDELLTSDSFSTIKKISGIVESLSKGEKLI